MKLSDNESKIGPNTTKGFNEVEISLTSHFAKTQNSCRNWKLILYAADHKTLLRIGYKFEDAVKTGAQQSSSRLQTWDWKTKFLIEVWVFFLTIQG